ncbi:MAG TPA: CinA family protein [Casimicrobiaceae bacterium]|nr:CinA family protein [Casimicrobiaceae bacterium]
MSDALRDALAAELGALLSARRWRVVTAESCTGGLLAGAITAIAGSSGWFDVGYVTYGNDAKIRLLGVSPDALAHEGAVSEATARAMAEGARRASGADLAAAITGIAGPGGGTAQKPVGLVCFAWSREGSARAESRRFSGDRGAVREASVIAALEGLIQIARDG